MYTLLAFILVTVGLASALMVILKRELMQGALFLIVTLFSMAGIYLFLGAELLAAMQIIIYAGAIMVLIVFVIQLTGTSGSPQKLFQRQTPIAITVSALFFIQVIILTIRSVTALSSNEGTSKDISGNVLAFSRALFTKYIFPFEIASVLLLVAIFGTVLLAQRRGIRE